MMLITQKILSPVHQLDLRLFHWCMHRRRIERIATVSRWISRSADGFAYPVIAGLVWLLDTSVGSKLFWAMALAFAAERPLYWALKNSFRRNRPPSAIPGYKSFIVPSDQFSFPSGHTSGAFVTATLISAFYPLAAPILYFWACLVALSRVNLGVHFPSDTAAGAGMGYLMAWCSLTWVI